MHALATELAGAAVDRYAGFLTDIRNQVEIALYRGTYGSPIREEAFFSAKEAARRYVSLEQAHLNDESAEIARKALKQVNEDLGVQTEGLHDRFADFIYSAASYTATNIAAQAERDVMTVARQMRTDAQRVDLYVRSGRYSQATAVAAVMLENRQSPAFQFVDRIGRRFKSTKHIRDTYRHHALTTYNEVYMDLVAEHGHDVVYVDHPDPDYRMIGQALALVDVQDATPLYYDMREEIFHPSSNATLTINQEG